MVKVSGAAETGGDIFNSFTVTCSLPPALLAMPRTAFFTAEIVTVVR